MAHDKVLGGLFLMLLAAARLTAAQTMCIPAYYYPGSLWTQSVGGAPTVSQMIMNPNSGPGTAVDPNYRSAMSAAQAKGIKILGYVHTSYGQRSATVVQAEMDAYYLWSRQRNAGCLYVTTDSGGNPYDTLPAYWSAELAELRK